MRRMLAALLSLVLVVPAVGETVRSEAAGLRFSVPGDWTRVPAPSDMRAAQFKVPRAGTDAEDAELVLFFFGPGQGGSAEQNVDRWAGRIVVPGGKATREYR